jgi:hypothetical protein
VEANLILRVGLDVLPEESKIAPLAGCVSHGHATEGRVRRISGGAPARQDQRT